MNAPVFSSISVHQACGAQFATRLCEPAAFRVLGELTENEAEYNLRTVSTAIRYLVEHPDVKRVFVPVDMKSLDSHSSAFAAMLMTVPEAYRAKMFLELKTNQRLVSETVQRFALHIQDECAMSVLVWTRCCDSDYVRHLMEYLNPSVLGIDKRCTKQAAACEDKRWMLLDAMEEGVSCGARVLVEGVDTEDELSLMRKIGVDLLCGEAISTCAPVAQGDYRRNAALMSAHDRRIHRAKA